MKARLSAWQVDAAQQALDDKRADAFLDLGLADLGHRGRRRQGEAAYEDAELSELATLLGVQQRVTPGDRRPQRLMALRLIAQATRQ